MLGCEVREVTEWQAPRGAQKGLSSTSPLPIRCSLRRKLSGAEWPTRALTGRPALGRECTGGGRTTAGKWWDPTSSLETVRGFHFCSFVRLMLFCFLLSFPFTE